MSDTTTETPEVENTTTSTRVSAATVTEAVFNLIKEAGKDGITLKDLGRKAKETGVYKPELTDTEVYRKLHNVTWVLEGGPKSGKIEAKGWPELVSRVEGKGATYVATAPKFKSHKG